MEFEGLLLPRQGMAAMVRSMPGNQMSMRVHRKRSVMPVILAPCRALRQGGENLQGRFSYADSHACTVAGLKTLGGRFLLIGAVLTYARTLAVEHQVKRDAGFFESVPPMFVESEHLSW